MIPPESRYNYAATMQIVDATGQLIEFEHLDLRPQLVDIVHSDNQEFLATAADNWSKLAWRKLGDGRRYWIIADYSQIVDPWSELAPVQKTQALTQLSVDVPAASVNSFVVKDARKITKGMLLRVEDLNPNHLTTFDCAVQSVNLTTKTVYVSPVTAPSVPAALSRVSKVYTQGVKLTCPSTQRAFFDALQFGNPMSTLND